VILITRGKEREMEQRVSDAEADRLVHKCMAIAEWYGEKPNLIRKIQALGDDLIDARAEIKRLEALSKSGEGK
jgi:hypothetical protein